MGLAISNEGLQIVKKKKVGVTVTGVCPALPLTTYPWKIKDKETVILVSSAVSSKNHTCVRLLTPTIHLLLQVTAKNAMLFNRLQKVLSQRLAITCNLKPHSGETVPVTCEKSEQRN